MAEVGVLEVRLQADTADYDRDIKAAQAGMEAFRRAHENVARAMTGGARAFDVEIQKFHQLKAQFDAGTISSETYAGSLQSLQARIGALQKAQIQPAAHQMGVLANIMGSKVPTAATKARQGLGTIRSAGASLTARLISLNGTVGTLLSGLLQFAAGNAVAVGIVAGIASIAAGMRLLGKEAREAKEQNEDLVKSLGKLENQFQFSAQLVAARSQLDELIERRDELLEVRRRQTEQPGTLTPAQLALDATRELNEVEQEIREQRRTVLALEGKISEERQNQNNAAGITVTTEKELRELARAREKAQLALNMAKEEENRQTQLALELAESQKVKARERAAIEIAVADAAKQREIFKTFGSRLKSALEEAQFKGLQLNKEIVKEARRTGVALGDIIGRFLAEGIRRHSTAGIGSLLGGAIALISGLATGNPFLVAGGIAGVVEGASGLGSKPPPVPTGPGLLGQPPTLITQNPTDVTVNVNPTLSSRDSNARVSQNGPPPSLSGAAVTPVLDFSTFPPAQNPLASARDVDWQRFLDASLGERALNGA